MNTKEKNRTLNLYKGIACMLVVVIHCGFPGSFGLGVLALARNAVPMFFVISGFFFYKDKPEQMRSRIPAKVKHILTLAIIGTALQAVWAVYMDCFSGETVPLQDYLKGHLAFARWVEFIVYNKPLWGGQLWFLWALVYCYLLMYPLAKVKKPQTQIAIIIFLFSAHFALGNIMPVFFDRTVSVYWYRNAWLMGIPFFMLGGFIRRTGRKKASRTSTKTLMILACIGVLLSISSAVRNGVHELYPGNILSVTVFFLLALRFPDPGKGRCIEWIGEKLSLYVFILHLIAVDIVNHCGGSMGMATGSLYQFLRPVVAIASSLLLASGVYAGLQIVTCIKKRLN